MWCKGLIRGLCARGRMPTGGDDEHEDIRGRCRVHGKEVRARDATRWVRLEVARGRCGNEVAFARCGSSGQATAIFVSRRSPVRPRGVVSVWNGLALLTIRDYLLSGCTEAGATGEAGGRRSVRAVTPWRWGSGCRISVWVASLTREPKGCTFLSLSGWIGSRLVSRFLFPIRLRGPDVIWALVNEVPRA